MTRDLDVIVHGICTTDILFSGLSKLPSPGEEVYSPRLGYAVGGSFITAAALARLGIQVGVVCPLGTDNFSVFIKDAFEAESVVPLTFETNRRQMNVSVCMNLPDDRAIVSYSDKLSQKAFVAHSLDVLCNTEARIVHVNACEETKLVISQAHAKGMYVSMDVAWDKKWLRSASILNVISSGDLFMPNEREARTITNAATAEEAIRVLKKYVPNVIIKLGEHGALCWGESEVAPRVVPPFAVSHIVDTTGAGDNFDAGVLYGVLRSLDLYASTMLGNYCGSVSLQGIGGTSHMASHQEIETCLKVSRHAAQL